MLTPTTTPGASVVGRGAPSGALAFSASRSEFIRTNVYVDGFNFYYGELRHTGFKWLDLEKFFDVVLGDRHQVCTVKFFTAKVQDRTQRPGGANRQELYLRALRNFCPRVEIVYGHFLRHRIRMEHAEPPPPSVKVWKTEEKGSDVNLAVQLLNDAWMNAFDSAVVVSNDSDLASSLQLVRATHQKKIGLITPGAPKRRASSELRRYADFIRPLRRWHFEASQLPTVIPNTRIQKPIDW